MPDDNKENENVAPIEEYFDAYEYMTSPDVQDILTNDFDLEADQLTAPVDSETSEVVQNTVENQRYPSDIQNRLKQFQEEYQLDDSELDMVVQMILAERRAFQAT